MATSTILESGGVTEKHRKRPQVEPMTGPPNTSNQQLTDGDCCREPFSPITLYLNQIPTALHVLSSDHAILSPPQTTLPKPSIIETHNV